MWTNSPANYLPAPNGRSNMLDVDHFNPLNRFLLKKDQSAVVADQEDPSSADPKVVPIKPPCLKAAALARLSVTQLLIVPIALAGIYFYGIARIAM